jgi:hypothetical protein
MESQKKEIENLQKKIEKNKKTLKKLENIEVFTLKQRKKKENAINYIRLDEIEYNDRIDFLKSNYEEIEKKERKNKEKLKKFDKIFTNRYKNKKNKIFFRKTLEEMTKEERQKLKNAIINNDTSFLCPSICYGIGTKSSFLLWKIVFLICKYYKQAQGIGDLMRIQEVKEFMEERQNKRLFRGIFVEFYREMGGHTVADRPAKK